MSSRWDQLVEEGVLEGGVRLDALTTYKLGGPARYFLEAHDRQDLEAVTPVDIDVLVVGRGSNLLVADEGFPGLVIRLGRGFGGWDIEDDGVLAAGAAAPLPSIARAAAKAGRGGLEWMVGVPGSVGEAVRMNAGCFGSDTSQALRTAEVLDLRLGEITHRTPAQLEMAYRSTNLTPTEAVLAAAFTTTGTSPEHAEAQMREITRWRKEHQPGGTFNAGSVFKNPPGDSAGRLIDSLGLKGFRVGGVSVSEKHANFFVADPGATARQIFLLVAAVRRRVLEEAGIELVPEIQFAGFEDTT